MIDYLMSLFVIASPWIFDFARNGAETWVPVVLGAMAIVYSLMTNYEMGGSRVLSMRTHLGLDVASGAVLALSPWIFEFNDYVYLPHLIFGLVEIGVPLMTDPAPYRGAQPNITGQHAH